MKGLQPVLINKKRRINGEAIDLSSSTLSTKVDVIDAGCTTIENMLLRVQAEGRQIERGKDSKSVEELFEIVEEHNSRIKKCEQMNQSLQKQFSDLSQLVNSSLLSSLSQTSLAGVSHISITQDDLASINSHLPIIIPPLFIDTALPEMRHIPVESTPLSRWTIDRIDELAAAASVTLQCWLREKQQLLLLKHMLIQSRCTEDEGVEEWYQQEIDALQTYYKEENNILQVELRDIRKLSRCLPHSAKASEYTKSISSEKKESEIQIRSIPQLEIKKVEGSLEIESYMTQNSQMSEKKVMQNDRIISYVMENIDFLLNIACASQMENGYELQKCVMDALPQDENIAFADIIALTFSSELFAAMNELDVDPNDFSSLSLIKATMIDSLTKQRNHFNTVAKQTNCGTLLIPIQLARKDGIEQINKLNLEIQANMDDYLNEISRDVFEDITTSEL